MFGLGKEDPEAAIQGHFAAPEFPSFIHLSLLAHPLVDQQAIGCDPANR